MRVPIEMPKLGYDMETRASGVIVEILQPAGSEVPVGAPIGTLEADA